MARAGVLSPRELTAEEREQAILELPLSPFGLLGAVGRLPAWLARLLGRGRKAATTADALAARQAAADAEARIAGAEAAARKARKTDVFLRPGTPIQRAAVGAAAGAVGSLAGGPAVLEFLRRPPANGLPLPPGAPGVDDLAPPLPVVPLLEPDILPEAPTLPPTPIPPVVPRQVAFPALPEAPVLVRVERTPPRELAAQRRLSRAQAREQREAAMWAETGAVVRQLIASSGDVFATALSNKWGAATIGVPISLLVLGGLLTPDQRSAQAQSMLSSQPRGWAPEEAGDRTEAAKPPAPVVDSRYLSGEAARLAAPYSPVPVAPGLQWDTQLQRWVIR